MKAEDFSTKEINTWCPGCPNSGILLGAKTALAELVSEGKLKQQNLALVTGIGCHGKIYDYLNINGFNGIHGRVLPIALGMKLANPELKVIGFGGDGDTFDEGMGHFVHAGRYNADMTLIVHANQVFALTTGQANSLTEEGFTGSIPGTEGGKTINPLVLAMEAGATFVARGFALRLPQLKELMKKAILHSGFSFLEVLQPCIVYHKHALPYLNKNVSPIGPEHDSSDIGKALELAKTWDYSYRKDSRVLSGIFYEIERPTFESQWPQLKTPWHKFPRTFDWQKAAGEFKQ